METTARPSLDQIDNMARRQREVREAAQAHVLEAQRSRQQAEESVRRALLVEWHLYRAAALSRGQGKADRFEEAYLRWQTGMRDDTLELHPLMFDTEKVYLLVRFLHRQELLPAQGFDGASLRIEFPNWVDDMSLVPTDGSIRAALKALVLRRAGVSEVPASDGLYAYTPDTDAEPRFRRKSRPEEM